MSFNVQIIKRSERSFRFHGLYNIVMFEISNLVDLMIMVFNH